MYLVTVISSRNLLHAIMKREKKSPSDPDNAGGGGGGGGGVGGGGSNYFSREVRISFSSRE